MPKNSQEGLGLGLCLVLRSGVEYAVWRMKLWGRNVTNNLFNTLYVRFNKRLNQSVCAKETSTKQNKSISYNKKGP